MIHRFNADDPLKRVRPVLSTQELLSLQDQIATARVEPALEDYIIGIVHSTRDHPHWILAGARGHHWRFTTRHRRWRCSRGATM